MTRASSPRPLQDPERQYCEGCARPALSRLPVGWSQCGPSRAGAQVLALWCPTCATDGTFDRFLAGLPTRGSKAAAA